MRLQWHRGASIPLMASRCQLGGFPTCKESYPSSVTLPAEVDGAKAEAAIENGVLTLRLPKAETAKPKTIKISAK